mmetsp:Transcript_24956/g.45849  ORF Transcript_24956/g.45849 Transcript_24956/m.45849 type:complete len:520 (+) Transcript_24956:54-1613(+)
MPPKTQRAKRIRFTASEDAALRDWVQRHRGCKEQGAKIWKEAEAKNLTRHTWQAMLQRWRTKLQPRPRLLRAAFRAAAAATGARGRRCRRSPVRPFPPPPAESPPRKAARVLPLCDSAAAGSSTPASSSHQQAVIVSDSPVSEAQPQTAAALPQTRPEQVHPQQQPQQEDEVHTSPPVHANNRGTEEVHDQSSAPAQAQAQAVQAQVQEEDSHQSLQQQQPEEEDVHTAPPVHVDGQGSVQVADESCAQGHPQLQEVQAQSQEDDSHQSYPLAQRDEDEDDGHQSLHDPAVDEHPHEEEDEALDFPLDEEFPDTLAMMMELGGDSPRPEVTPRRGGASPAVQTPGQASPHTAPPRSRTLIRSPPRRDGASSSSSSVRSHHSSDDEGHQSPGGAARADSREPLDSSPQTVPSPHAVPASGGADSSNPSSGRSRNQRKRSGVVTPNVEQQQNGEQDVDDLTAMLAASPQARRETATLQPQSRAVETMQSAEDGHPQQAAREEPDDTSYPAIRNWLQTTFLQ